VDLVVLAKHRQGISAYLIREVAVGRDPVRADKHALHLRGNGDGAARAMCVEWRCDRSASCIALQRLRRMPAGARGPGGLIVQAA
jgi:hypothetical protein